MLLDLIAPRHCAACDVPLGDEDLFCAACDGTPLEAPDFTPLSGDIPILAGGRYDGVLGRAIRRMKYDDRPDLAAPLGQRLARTVARHPFRGPVLLVPVPLHPRKLAERGFNQSALVARALGAELGLQVRTTVLRRVRDTSGQARLGREERLENVRAAISSRTRLDGKLVVVVDDVVTTGATALGCIDALRLAGATPVAVAAVARA